MRVNPEKSSKDNPGMGADLVRVAQKKLRTDGKLTSNGSSDPKVSPGADFSRDSKLFK
jgi:translation elongation factor P/translation initiation factor 5A